MTQQPLIESAITSFSGPWRFLSNFYPVDVLLDGVPYQSVEHAYQAAKTQDADKRAMIRTCLTAGMAKKMATALGLRKGGPTANTPEQRLAAMEDLLRQKFSYPILRGQLSLTHDRELIEGNHWGDTYWGVCRGVGENHLGRLLMKIRAELSARSSSCA